MIQTKVLEKDPRFLKFVFLYIIGLIGFGSAMLLFAFHQSVQLAASIFFITFIVELFLALRLRKLHCPHCQQSLTRKRGESSYVCQLCSIRWVLPGVLNSQEIEAVNVSLPEKSFGFNAPELWNPNAAIAWSVLLFQPLGPYLHAINWRNLGHPEKFKKSMVWFYVMLGLYGINLIFPNKLLGKILMTTAIVWMFNLGLKQVYHVRERFKSNYPRRSWVNPILISVLLIIVYWFCLVVRVQLAPNAFISFNNNSMSSHGISQVQPKSFAFRNIFITKAALWNKKFWYLESKGEVHPNHKKEEFRSLTLKSISLDADTKDKPEVITQLPVEETVLLADSDRLWIIALQKIGFYKEGQMQFFNDTRPLEDFSNPFLFEGYPSVLALVGLTLRLESFKDEHWVSGPPLTENYDGEAMLLHTSRVLSKDGRLVLFTSLKGKLVYREIAPLAPVPWAESWTEGPDLQGAWDVAYLGNEILLFASDSTHEIIKWKKSEGADWEQIGRIPGKYVNLALYVDEQGAQFLATQSQDENDKLARFSKVLDQGTLVLNLLESDEEILINP